MSKLAITNDEVIDVVDEFILLSKIDEKIDRVCRIAGDILENDRCAMTVSDFEKYRKIVIFFFNPEDMKKNIRKTISSDCKIDISRAVNFLNTPKLIELNRREEGLNFPGIMEKMEKYFSTLQKTPAIQVRKKLIETIDKLTYSSAMAITLQVEFFKAIAFGMRSLNKDNQPSSQESCDRIAADMKNQVSQNIERQVWMGLLFAYKDVSDEELESCIFLLESIDGKMVSEFSQSVYLKMYCQVVRQIRDALEIEFPLT